LSQHLELLKTAIYCPALNASFKPLTGSSKGKHGLNPSGIIGDELHEWPDGDLYTFVHQGTAARQQPIEFLISTAGTRTGYGWETWQYCQRVLAGEIEDPETLIVIYAASPDDDWTDPATWRKANPNFGVSVKPEYLEAECRKAQSSPRLENDFKRYHLNLWTEQATRFLPMDLWGPVSDAWAAPEFESALFGRRCFGGMDLSTTRDLSAYCLWFPPEEVGGRWVKLTRAFVPEANIEARVRQDRAPYDQWIRSGALTATPGNMIDYEFIKARLYEDAERFHLQALAVDRFLAPQIVMQLREEGVNALLMGQGFLSMSAPTKELERLVLGQLVDHGGHPVAHWCAANVAVRTDPAGNIKPDKERSTERIDVVVADINALAAALTGAEESKSFWEVSA
jgi:phage terminase large subunit-like protein